MKYNESELKALQDEWRVMKSSNTEDLTTSSGVEDIRQPLQDGGESCEHYTYE